jgi:hypothetical protein
MERDGAGGQMALDAAAVERVLRRANEMSADRDGAIFARRTMSEDIVVAAAAEVGIAPEMVRLSLAMERLGPLPKATGLDRLSGPDEVVVQRAVGLEATAVLQRLDHLLVGQHQLRRERTWPNAMQWRRRTDPLGWMQRTIRNFSGQAPLGKSEVITAVVASVEDRRTMVRLTLHRPAQRSGAIAGGAVVTTTGAAGVAILAAALTPLVLIASPAVVVVGVAVTAHGRRQAEDATRELECLLDDVEQGARPPALARAVRTLTRATKTATRDSWL